MLKMHQRDGLSTSLTAKPTLSSNRPYVAGCTKKKHYQHSSILALGSHVNDVRKCTGSDSVTSSADLWIRQATKM